MVSGIDHGNQWRAKQQILPLIDEKKEEEPTKPTLKPLPSELKYAYLDGDDYPVVISSKLTAHQEECLIEVLKRCK